MSFKRKTFSASSPAPTPATDRPIFRVHERLCRGVITGNFKAIRTLLAMRYFTCCDNPGIPDWERCHNRGCPLAKDSKVVSWRRRCWDDDLSLSLQKAQDAFRSSVIRNIPDEVATAGGADDVLVRFDRWWKWVLGESPVTKTMQSAARRYADARWPQLK